MGVEGPKEKEKGKKESFMRRFFVVFEKEKKKSSKFILHQTCETERRTVGSDERMVAARNAMAGRD